MYTLAAALGMVLLEAILPMLTAPPGSLPPWRRLAVYAVCAALGLWVLYYFAFLLVAINLMVAPGGLCRISAPLWPVPLLWPVSDRATLRGAGWCAGCWPR